MTRDRTAKERVVVTGMGALSPLGLTAGELWNGLVQGRSGIDHMTLCDTTGFPCTIAGEIKGFVPEKYIDPKQARRMARFSQIAIAAAREAIESAHLDLSKEDRARCGVLLGNGNGGFPTTEDGARTLITKGGSRVSPFFMPMILPNMAACQVSLTYGLRGYSSTVITACAAGTQAIGAAAEIVRRGAADVMLSGGTEAGISQLGLAGFCALRALSTRRDSEPTKASRPFEATRDGFVPAEGSAILILESLEHASKRGAPILAEVVGYGVTADAYHMVEPCEDGDGAARAMKLTIEDAGLRPSDIDYINAHGTSTPLNDSIETLAIKSALGEFANKVPISSTKSMIGHALGAAGALEAVACVKTLLENTIHPTINYEQADPKCDLDYVPNVARKKEVRRVMSNSFGFGGQNACLIFGKFEGK